MKFSGRIRWTGTAAFAVEQDGSGPGLGLAAVDGIPLPVTAQVLAGLLGKVKLDLKLPDVQLPPGTLAERWSTRSVRLARMILIQAIRNAMVHDLAVRTAAELAAVPSKGL